MQKKKINEISDGERQKIMIAGALAQNTDIILLDEPAAFLDAANKFEIFDILQKSAVEEDKSIVFSTHDFNIATKQADKIWLIKNKSVIQGAPEDLMLKNVFSDIFDSDKIIFDTETQNFKTALKPDKPIKMLDKTNNATVKLLTEKALNRKRYYLSEQNTGTSITVKNDTDKITWSLKKNQNEFNFSSIYELIRNL